ncbi:hypothetical protein ACM66Z_07135 [Sulfurovum sp. ST-21]|uniref:Uncharacterized protein n=1 Tax=Sulfurovum indicum TaxID=2779528 RepID=A0A7M1S1J8_9BACT|nr:hypothetical protein [Sulfurovum indicum]QOR61226.1 hypothetical protein IMZ28_07130 [Sulfurovum indicum]
MTAPIITKHAKRRLKQRAGLAKRAHEKHIYKVLKEGMFLYRNRENNVFYMRYHTKEYVFGLTKQLEPILITLYLKYP